MSTTAFHTLIAILHNIHTAELHGRFVSLPQLIMIAICHQRGCYKTLFPDDAGF